MERRVKRRFPKIGAVLTAAAVLFSTVALAVPASAEEEPAGQAIQLEKTATPVAGSSDEWQMNLKIQGYEKQVALTQSSKADIVLVIDHSGSMDANHVPTKMNEAIASAKDFVGSTLTPDYPNVKVGVVSYDSRVTTNAGLTGYSAENVQSLKDKIGGMTAVYGGDEAGDNTQGGLKQAQDLLDADTSVGASDKYVVLLTDGDQPSGYYKATATKSVPTFNIGTHSYDYLMTDFDYSNPLIDNDGTFVPSDYYTVDGHQVTDTLINTYSQAQMLKDKGYTVFTIGYDLNADGEPFMQSLASDTSDSFEAEKGNLATIFQQNVLKKLTTVKKRPAGTNGVVTDPMGDMFTLEADTIKAGAGDTTVSPDGQTISWDVGDVDDSDNLTLTYKVKIKPEADIGKLYDTNKTTTLHYTDGDGEKAKQDFPIPKESLTGYTVAYYKDGESTPFKTTEKKADVGTKVTTYEDEAPSGYSLDKTENLPLTVKADFTQNVINVYYKQKATTPPSSGTTTTTPPTGGTTTTTPPSSGTTTTTPPSSGTTTTTPPSSGTTTTTPPSGGTTTTTPPASGTTTTTPPSSSTTTTPSTSSSTSVVPITSGTIENPKTGISIFSLGGVAALAVAGAFSLLYSVKKNKRK